MSDKARTQLSNLSLSPGSTFNVGDVCQLRSGGPYMTMVKNIAGDISCAWFLPAGGIMEAKFPALCLRAVDMDKLRAEAKAKPKVEGAA